MKGKKMWIMIGICVMMVVLVSGQDCKYVVPFNPNIHYDLSSMKRTSPAQDYQAEYTGYKLNVNICATTVSAPPDHRGCQENTPGYMTYGLYSCNDFGKLSQMHWSVLEPSNLAAGVTLIYGTSECSYTRLLKVNIHCDPTAETPRVISASTADSCTWTMNINARAGCPIEVSADDSDDGPLLISVGWLLIILLIACVLIYLVCGALWRWKVKGAEIGTDLIPNKEFWKDLPWLVKDGMVYSYHKTFFCINHTRERYNDLRK
eukprot:TRINITY_DN12541_c0_g1_i1.p1 TRINITY_DN12541_c0_g1~~TRINITY_DN12541_c0_g1_i1.p1  ORF type:complete len:306 (-),score=33.79 TRINITY_DN12541_c0_g1_i1:16-801(-)